MDAKTPMPEGWLDTALETICSDEPAIKAKLASISAADSQFDSRLAEVVETRKESRRKTTAEHLTFVRETMTRAGLTDAGCLEMAKARRNG